MNGQYGRRDAPRADGIYPTVGLGLLLIRVVAGIIFYQIRKNRV